MEKYILTGVCILVIVVMCIQLYRTYCWKKMLRNKQAEFVKNPHVRTETKPLYASLGIAACCMLMIFVYPESKEKASFSLSASGQDQAEEYSSDAVFYDVNESTRAETAMDTIISNEGIAATKAKSVLSGLITAQTALLNDTSIMIQMEQVNPLASVYSEEDFANLLRDKQLQETENYISESDYMITIIYGDSSTVYAFKEFDDCFILCDAEYSECYYIEK